MFTSVTFSSKRRYSDLSECQIYLNCLGCYPTTSMAQPEVCVCCEHPVLRNLPPEAILLRKNIPITCPNDCVSNNYYLRSRLDELLNRRNLKRVTYFNLPYISQQTKFRPMGTGGHSPGVKRDRVVKFTTHPDQVPRSIMSRRYIPPPLSPAWR
jgi:hypothetical protein